MIKLRDLITEGKISSDIERIAKKFDIKFKKKTKTVFTDKFLEPQKIDPKDFTDKNRFTLKGEDVKMIVGWIMIHQKIWILKNF